MLHHRRVVSKHTPVFPHCLAILALASPAVSLLCRIEAAEPAADAPVIVWASSPVRPDETVVIAGHALATVGGRPHAVELAPLENTPPGPPPAGPESDQASIPPSTTWQPQPALQSDAEGAAAVIPAAWPQAIWACRVNRGDAKAKENGGGVVYLPRGRYGLTKPWSNTI